MRRLPQALGSIHIYRRRPRLICAVVTSCALEFQQNRDVRVCCAVYVSSRPFLCIYTSTYTGVLPAWDRVTRIDMIVVRVTVAVCGFRGAQVQGGAWKPRRRQKVMQTSKYVKEKEKGNCASSQSMHCSQGGGVGSQWHKRAEGEIQCLLTTWTSKFGCCRI